MSAWIHDLVTVARTTAEGLGLLSTIQVASVTGSDEYGEQTYGSARSVFCYIKQGGIKQPPAGATTGEPEPGSKISILIPSNDPIAVTDRVTLPDGTQYKVLEVEGGLDSAGEKYSVRVSI